MKVVGILGAGQLAQMMALSAKSLDCRFVFLDPSSEACAFPLGEKLLGAYDDSKLLEQLASASDVVTFEFENVPARVVAQLSKHVTCYPPANALEICQDRLKEKQTFERLKIPTTKFFAVNSLEDLKSAVPKLGLPAVLKTRSQGYDGKGQKVIRSEADIVDGWNALGKSPLILEEFIPFEREVSIIAVRSIQGEVKFYSLCENEHHEGILRLTRNLIDDPMQEKAQVAIQKLLADTNYVGVMALEMFQKGNELIANEIAPRVHNSGHWTIEGAETSQFENHLRAVLELPLKSTKSVGHSAMVNCIGEIRHPEKISAIPNAHLHNYGKSFRAGRKVGHVTIQASTRDEVDLALKTLLSH